MEFVPIVKPVGGRCNLHCFYCYFDKEKENQLLNLPMNEKTLKQVIDAFCFNQGVVEFIWHGGEPLLVGIDFYKKALVFQSEWIKKGCRIYNSVQTNGTMIDEKWANFLSQNGFGVGVSLDGPMGLHDQLRKTRQGKGSFQKVVKAIHLLKEKGIQPSVICCVSSINCRAPKEVFDSLVSLGFKKIKFLQVQGRNNRGELLPYSVNPAEYANFLLSIFKRWVELDDVKIEIREIKSIVNAMLGGNYRECVFAGECYKYLTIYPDGSIYGCDSLSNIDFLYFGNVAEGLKRVESSSNFVQFRRKLTDIEKGCGFCKWFNICRGGCLQDYWPDIFYYGTKNFFCESLKKVFREIQEVLKHHKLI